MDLCYESCLSVRSDCGKNFYAGHYRQTFRTCHDFYQFIPLSVTLAGGHLFNTVLHTLTDLGEILSGVEAISS